jgi:hypothetical protein
MSKQFTLTYAVIGTIAAAYTLVASDTTGPNSVHLSGAAETKQHGVVSEEGTTNGYAPVVYAGVYKVRAGAAVVPGDYIQSDSTGRGIPIVPAAFGDILKIAGKAETGAAAAGEIFMMRIGFS